MRYVNAVTAVALFGLAVFRMLPPGDLAAAILFAFGGVAAALAATHWLHTQVVRVLALLSTIIMFCFFWQFFSLAPTLQAGWYLEAGTLDAVGLLIAGFGMIPVLSEYTCRMKASGNCARARRKAASGAPILASLRALASRQTT